MTVKLLTAWIDPDDGKRYLVGNLLTKSTQTEAGLVAQKIADSNTAGGTLYVAPLQNPGRGGFLEWNPALTAPIDPVSGAGINLKHKRLTVEIANINNVGVQPSGSEWLLSAAQNLDTFTGYLDFTPTIFFDPDATTSLGYGTEDQPYNTMADVNRVMVGNRSGTVLGIKRGSRLYTHGSATGPGLNITCYGTAANPVLIVPYGDIAKPMPIIDGGEVTGTGTSYVWTLSSGSVWRVACTVDTDVFESGVRCLKKTTTPAAAGQCQYSAGYLYYWPRTTTNPNDGTLKIPFTQWGIDIRSPNVAASGNIKLIGIDVQYARGNNVRIAPADTNGAITSIGAVDLLFCRLSRNGFDATSFTISGSTTAVSYNGIHATVRLGTTETISSRVIGCEISDCTHHGVEFSMQDNSLCENNYIHDCWGSPIEYYTDCSGNTFRNNLCKTFSGYGRLYTTKGSFALLYNFTVATYGGATAYDDAHTKNVNNSVYNNSFKDCALVMFVCTGGSGHKIYNNTCDINHDAIYAGDATKSHLPSGLNIQRAQIVPSGTTHAANGFLTYSNNLLYYRYSPLMKAAPGYQNPALIVLNTLGVGSATPVGDKNVYIIQVGYTTGNWNYNGAGQTDLITYKTALATYGFEQNSLASYGLVHPVSGSVYGASSGNLTVEALKYTELTGRPAAGSPLIQGGANVNANRLADYTGQTVIAVATPAIGCYER